MGDPGIGGRQPTVYSRVLGIETKAAPKFFFELQRVPSGDNVLNGSRVFQSRKMSARIIAAKKFASNQST